MLYVGIFMKELIIFDLDGTLLNTITDLGIACNEALSHFGYPTHALSDYPHFVGNGVNNLIRRALPINAQTEENIQLLRTIFIPYYDAHNCVCTKPYDGIVEMLYDLKSKGIKMAVASNKYQAATEQIVKKRFPNTFDIVLGEREGIARKPNPQIIYDILTELYSEDYSKLTPDSLRDKVLYIGDSDVDIQTAKAANLPVVACTWGFCTEKKLCANEPDYVIHHPSEILNLL